MRSETVMLVPTGMEGPLRELALDACARADVRACVWDADTTQAADTPALLMAGLPAGERQIPPGVGDLIARVFPATPLLLLCNEPIVRPTITLQHGRVALLGEPLTVERVSSRIRTTLSGAQTSGLSDGSGPGRPGETRVREFRGREWWAGVIARPDAGESGADLMPVVARPGRQGCLALLAADARQRDAAARVRELAHDAAAHPGTQLEPALLARAAGLAAALWYVPSSQHWATTLAPGIRGFLYSPVRLPTSWPLSNAADGGIGVQLAAGSGDVMLLWNGAAAEALDKDAADGGLWRIAQGGGPAVLDHFEACFAATGGWSSGVVVELR